MQRNGFRGGGLFVQVGEYLRQLLHALLYLLHPCSRFDDHWVFDAGPGATFNLPVYLDAHVLEYLAERAKTRGVPLNELVNQLLKKDIELIEAGR